jgi:hypothetical protein
MNGRVERDIQRSVYTYIPVVGSSRNIISGAPNVAIANDNRRFIPPLNLAVGVLIKSFK